MILLPLLIGAAQAADLVDLQPDNTFGIFAVNASLTTGPVAGFRQLYLEPDAVPAALGGAGPAWLALPNEVTTWGIVSVNGVRLGQLMPLSTGVIRGVKAGTYDVVLELPNGFQKRFPVEATAERPGVKFTE